MGHFNICVEYPLIIKAVFVSRWVPFRFVCCSHWKRSRIFYWKDVGRCQMTFIHQRPNGIAIRPHFNNKTFKYNLQDWPTCLVVQQRKVTGLYLLHSILNDMTFYTRQHCCPQYNWNLPALTSTRRTFERFQTFSCKIGVLKDSSKRCAYAVHCSLQSKAQLNFHVNVQFKRNNILYLFSSLFFFFLHYPSILNQAI